MQIRRTTNVQTTNSVNLQTQNNTKSASGNVAAPVDQLDFSAEAQQISRSSSTSQVRMDRVSELKTQIANGNYDTPEKMEAAVSRMLDEMG